MKFILLTVVLCALGAVNSADQKCTRAAITTASGSALKSQSFCYGDLIFEDQFDFLDFDKWQHENTLAGGGNWEFQWYTNNRTNSFTSNGNLILKPTMTAGQIGEAALSSGSLNLHGGAPADWCTNAADYGCERTGSPNNVLNPIKSARLRTVDSFTFRYGKVEVRAKMPAGDWLWPAIWMMPSQNAYGSWPASGEVDILESRGNRALVQNGVNIGTQQVGSTLHWGPDFFHNRYEHTHWTRNNAAGYDTDFHVYGLDWTDQSIEFTIDGVSTGIIAPPAGGFWELGGLAQTNVANPWAGGSKMAPFDQKFYLIMNLAVGGVVYFPDDAQNPSQKPWNNQSPQASTDFWNGRGSWQPTWNGADNSESLQVDYIRVYAL